MKVQVIRTQLEVVSHLGDHGIRPLMHISILVEGKEGLVLRDAK